MTRLRQGSGGLGGPGSDRDVEVGAFVGLMWFADRHAMHARSAGAEGRVALATEHWVRALACLEEAGDRGRRLGRARQG